MKKHEKKWSIMILQDIKYEQILINRILETIENHVDRAVRTYPKLLFSNQNTLSLQLDKIKFDLENLKDGLLKINHLAFQNYNVENELTKNKK